MYPLSFILLVVLRSMLGRIRGTGRLISRGDGVLHGLDENLLLRYLLNDIGSVGLGGAQGADARRRGGGDC